MNPAASAIADGSLNIWKPIAESASWRYVERSEVNAVGTPPTRPVYETSPYLVRYVMSEYEPAGVESARFGLHESSWRNTSIAVQAPWNRYAREVRVAVPPAGSQSCTAYVSVMSWPADVALHA